MSDPKRVLGLDPGYKVSALVGFDGARVTSLEIIENDIVLERLPELAPRYDVLVVEQISMGGMIAGAEIFETCFWSGRFAEAWSPKRWDRVKRKDVKLHLCGQVRAKDSNVRQALIDRFGPSNEVAIGKKDAKGPLYGVSSHCWAALAVAITWYDLNAHLDPVRPGIAAEF